MKGFRTVIFNAVMVLATGGTAQAALAGWISPATLAASVTALSAVWGFGGVLLRMLTTTPIGVKLAAVVEQDLGITPAQMAEFISHLPEPEDLHALVVQGRALLSDVAAVKASLALPPSGASATLSTAA